MAGEPYFVWNGIDSRSMGVWVQKYPAILRPKLRYQQVVIPGRPGALTLLEAQDAYETYTRDIKIMPKPGADRRAIMNWLAGRSEVIFGHEPDRSQKASIYDVVEFDREFADQWSAVITFMCDPFKSEVGAVEEYTPELAGGSFELANRGDVLAYPLIEVAASDTITLSINGTPLTLTGLEGRTATVDYEARTAYMEVEDEPESEPEEETEEETPTEEPIAEEPTTETEQTVTTTHLEPVVTHGDFAVLPNTGTTLIEWTEAVTALKITPRWRWF